ncbi:hypothetical protein HK100_011688 [Physocladia obscura]|uniref:Uncharacterized protein n=1 Tax=Physocladia obscura TaxID=109957 RepID=A0AAD5T2B8_9FUNG|nr:hypothetical protein HK100_011688 [Physocladia obscura]
MSLTLARIKAPPYLESQRLNSFPLAVHTTDLRKLKSLVADKTRDVNKIDSYHGFTALHLAVDENKFDFAAVLIDPASVLSEKDSKTRDLEGRTPLILAVIRSYSDIVHLLLKNGAKTDVQDMIGCAAIHYAIYVGDISSFKLLVDRGAKTDIIDKSGIPLFYHAIKCNRCAMAEHLIRGLSSETLDKPYGSDGSTALHYAVENNMPKIIHALVALGANPVSLDSEKRKPVERISFDEYNQEIVDFLTLTEISMFGSITSFVDTKGNEGSRSIADLISKSAANLAVSPNGSRSKLLNYGTKLANEEQFIPPLIIVDDVPFEVSNVPDTAMDGVSSLIVSFEDDDESVSELEVFNLSATVTDNSEEGDDNEILSEKVFKNKQREFMHPKASIRAETSPILNGTNMNSDAVVFEADSLIHPVLIKENGVSGSDVVNDIAAKSIDKRESNDDDDDADDNELLSVKIFKNKDICVDGKSDKEESTKDLNFKIDAFQENVPQPEGIQKISDFVHSLQQSVPSDFDQHFAFESKSIQYNPFPVVSTLLQPTFENQTNENSNKFIQSNEYVQTENLIHHQIPLETENFQNLDQKSEVVKSNFFGSPITLLRAKEAQEMRKLGITGQILQKKSNEQQDIPVSDKSKEMSTSFQLPVAQISDFNSPLSQEIKALNNSLDIANEKLKDQDLLKSAQETEILRLKQQADQYKNEIQLQTDLRTKLQFQIDGMTKDGDLKKMLADEYKQSQSLQLELNRTIERVTNLNDQIKSLQGTVLTLRTANLTISQKNAITEIKLQEEIETCKILESELLEAKINATEINEQYTMLETEYKIAIDKLNSAQDQINSIKIENQTLQMQEININNNLKQSDKKLLDFELEIKREKEKYERIERTELKMETELVALKTEIAIHKAAINTRDHQIDSFREVLKERKAEQEAQSLAARGTEINNELDNVRATVESDMVKYYEAEILNLNQQLKEVNTLKELQLVENVQLLSNFAILEENFENIQSKFKAQNEQLKEFHILQNEYSEKIQQLECAATNEKSDHEIQVEKFKNQVHDLHAVINTTKTLLAESNFSLNTIQKEKVQLRALWEADQLDCKEKLLAHQKELLDLEQANKKILETVSREYQAQLSEIRKESDSYRDSLEKSNLLISDLNHEKIKSEERYQTKLIKFRTEFEKSMSIQKQELESSKNSTICEINFEFETKLTDAEHQKNEITLKYQAALEKITEMQKNFDSVTIELKNSLEGAKTQIETFKQSNKQTLNTISENYEQQILDLTNNLEQLTAKLHYGSEESEEKILKLQHMLDNKSKELNILESENTDLKSEGLKLKVELETARAQHYLDSERFENIQIDHRKELQDLHSSQKLKFDEVNDYISQLQEDHSFAKSTSVELRIALDITKAELESLKHSSNAALNSVSGEYELQIKKIQIKFEECESKYAKCDQERILINEEASKLKDRLHEQIEQMKCLKADFDLLQSQNVELSSKVICLDAELKISKNQRLLDNNKIQSMYENPQKEILELQTDREALFEQLEIKGVEYANSLEKIQDFEEAILKLKEANRTLEIHEKNSRLEYDNLENTKNYEIKNLHEQLAHASKETTQIVELNTALISRCVDLDALIATGEKLEQKLREVTNLVAQRDAQISDLNEKLDSNAFGVEILANFQNKLILMEESAAAQEKKLSDLSALYSTCLNDFSNMKSSNKTEKNNYEVKISGFECDIENMLVEINQLQEDLLNAETELITLRESVKNVQKLLHDKEANLTATTEKLEEKENELIKSQNEFKLFESRLEKLSVELEDANLKIKQLSVKNQVLEISQNENANNQRMTILKQQETFKLQEKIECLQNATHRDLDDVEDNLRIKRCDSIELIEKLESVTKGKEAKILYRENVGCQNCETISESEHNIEQYHNESKKEPNLDEDKRAPLHQNVDLETQCDENSSIVKCWQEDLKSNYNEIERLNAQLKLRDSSFSNIKAKNIFLEQTIESQEKQLTQALLNVEKLELNLLSFEGISGSDFGKKNPKLKHELSGNNINLAMIKEVTSEFANRQDTLFKESRNFQKDFQGDRNSNEMQETEYLKIQSSDYCHEISQANFLSETAKNGALEQFIKQQETALAEQIFNVQNMEIHLSTKERKNLTRIQELELEVLEKITQINNQESDFREKINFCERKIKEVEEQKRNVLSELEDKQKKSAKYESICQQLSSIANLSQMSALNLRDCDIDQSGEIFTFESTETLADELMPRSHKKLKSKVDLDPALALTDFRSTLNTEVQAVIVKIAGLENIIQSDNEKIGAILQELESDETVEKDIKEIFKNVFMPQYERGVEARSIISATKKTAEVSLELMEKNFGSLIEKFESMQIQDSGGKHCLIEQKEIQEKLTNFDFAELGAKFRQISLEKQFLTKQALPEGEQISSIFLQLEKGISHKDTIINDQKAKILDLINILTEKGNEFENFKKICEAGDKSSYEDIHKYQIMSSSLKSENDFFRKEIEELRLKCLCTNSALNESKIECENLKNTVSTLKSNIFELEKEKKHVKIERNCELERIQKLYEDEKNQMANFILEEKAIQFQHKNCDVESWKILELEIRELKYKLQEFYAKNDEMVQNQATSVEFLDIKAKLEQEISHWKNESILAKSSLDNFKLLSEDRQTEITHLKMNNNNITFEIDHLKRSNHSINALLETAIHDLEKFKKSNSEAQKDEEILKYECEYLKDKCQELQSSLKRKSNLMQTLKAEIEEQKALNSQISAKNSFLEKELSLIKDQMSQERTHVESRIKIERAELTHTCEKLKFEASLHENELKTLRDEIQHHHKTKYELQAMKLEYEESNSVRKMLEEKLASIECQGIQQQQTVDQLIKELRDNSKLNTEFQQKIGHTEDRIKNFVNETGSTRDQNSNQVFEQFRNEIKQISDKIEHQTANLVNSLILDYFGHIRSEWVQINSELLSSLNTLVEKSKNRQMETTDKEKPSMAHANEFQQLNDLLVLQVKINTEIKAQNSELKSSIESVTMKISQMQTKENQNCQQVLELQQKINLIQNQYQQLATAHETLKNAGAVNDNFWEGRYRVLSEKIGQFDHALKLECEKSANLELKLDAESHLNRIYEVELKSLNEILSNRFQPQKDKLETHNTQKASVCAPEFHLMRKKVEKLEKKLADSNEIHEAKLIRICQKLQDQATQRNLHKLLESATYIGKHNKVSEEDQLNLLKSSLNALLS